MMRKIFLIMMLTVPACMMAQSDWQLPTQNKEVTQKNNKKTSEDSSKKAAKEEKKAAKKLDPKYGAGAVPQVEGQVEWQTTIKCPGQSADQLYDAVLKYMQDMTQAKNQKDSKIEAVNPREHVIAAKYIEEMVFTSNFISKDFCEFRYTIIATCKDNSVNIRLCRISYLYDVGRSTEQKYMAEEMITDKESMNKAGTKLYRIPGKFRKKTIDRKDEIFAGFEEKLKK